MRGGEEKKKKNEEDENEERKKGKPFRFYSSPRERRGVVSCFFMYLIGEGGGMSKLCFSGRGEEKG